MARQGVRSEWREVPGDLRRAVDELLGAPVVSTRPLEGGFSPGPAVRADLADGRRVFVKAVGAELNEESVEMHRREAAVLASLGSAVPAPYLEGVVDTGDWIALVVGWIDGRQPDAADPGDVQRLLELMARVSSEQPDPDEVGWLPMAEQHADLFGHWRELADRGAPSLDAWSRRHSDTLARVEALAVEATRGPHLQHVDVRTDNALLAASGPADDVLVDWPGASLGAPWTDLVAMLPSLHLDGGPPPEEALVLSPVGRRADPEAVDAFAVAIAGYFTRNSLQPPPPGLPTLRRFQAAQGEIARRWVADRLSLR
jgi:aminoglycoside phosphotransferase (APT) family kinase protein